MEEKNNPNLLKIKGKSLNPFSIAILLFFNFFLIFFTQSDSFNLDFLIVFSLLVIVFEVNKEESFITIGSSMVKLDNRTRNFSFFLITFTLFITLITYEFVINPLPTNNFLEKLIRTEKAIHLFFTITLMFVLYKAILIDFGTLIAITLLANLVYHLAFKGVLEMFFHIDYLNFISPEQDIRKEIESLLNTEEGGKLWENSEFNWKILNILLIFTGVLNNLFNTLYFIVLTKFIGKIILNLKIHFSHIYFPRKLIWIFILNGLTLWILLGFFEISSLISKETPSWIKLSLEITLSGIISFGFMYLIQGFSILFAYIHEKKFLGQPIFTPVFLIFLFLILGISIFTGSGIMIWITLFITILTMVGVSDTWIDYRKNYHYQNLSAD